MKFKTDENLPVEVAHLLRQEGHDALSVIDQQLAGRPDADVAVMCQSEQRALVTLDLDFSNIRAYPPADYEGIIVFRPAVQAVSAQGPTVRGTRRVAQSRPGGRGAAIRALREESDLKQSDIDGVTERHLRQAPKLSLWPT